MQQQIAKTSCACSRDENIAPWDFWLFPKLEEKLQSCRFEDEDLIREATKKEHVFVNACKGKNIPTFSIVCIFVIYTQNLPSHLAYYRSEVNFNFADCNFSAQSTVDFSDKSIHLPL